MSDTNQDKTARTPRLTIDQSAAPASDAWASVSPRSENRRSTIKIPIVGQRMPMQMDAKNAYRMKLKLKISLKTEKSGMKRLRFRKTAVFQFENPV